MRIRRRPLGLAAAVLAAASLAGCASSDDDAGVTGTGPPAGAAAPGAPRRRPPGVRLVRVRGGLGDALYVTHAPGQANRLFIVQQSGRILIQDRGRMLGRPFLDISSSISSGGERGLLGLAFHPGYASNGRFYVNYTDTVGRHARRRVPARRRRPREPR